MMVYFCVVWKLVDCINSEVYDTQVITKIKKINDKQSRPAETKVKVVKSNEKNVRDEIKIDKL